MSQLTNVNYHACTVCTCNVRCVDCIGTRCDNRMCRTCVSRIETMAAQRLSPNAIIDRVRVVTDNTRIYRNGGTNTRNGPITRSHVVISGIVGDAS